MQTVRRLDSASIALSTLCIVHCLALPVLIVALPFLALIADAEWVHWLLAACAIAASASVLAFAPDARRPRFVVPAISGLMLISGALLLDGTRIGETIPTVIGGVLLAAAHAGRLLNHR